MIFINLWYIPLALLVFGTLIFIHEFGHFFCARLFGVTIKEFAIGMGPKIFTKKSKKSETVYSLRLFPIGGFVSMVGEDEKSDDENAFCNKATWKRIIITVAGAAMNILLATSVMFAIVFATKSLASTTIFQFHEGAYSAQHGLCVGDKITNVGGTAVHTGNELVYEIMHKGYEPIDITVIRDGKRLVVEDVIFQNQVESGVSLGAPDFVVYAEHATFPNMLKHAVFRSLSTVKMICDSIMDLVSGRFGIEAVSGPVGATEMIGTAAETSVATFFYMFVVISMNLGIMNLLPFPALDGGRLIFLFIELIGRKKIKQEIEAYINFVGIVLLFAFMIFIAFKDIIKLF